MAQDNPSPETAEASPKKKGKLGRILLVLVLLLGAGGGAAYKFLVLDKQPADGDEVAEEVIPDPIYIELRPAFVVNLADTDASRFVQLEVDLLTREPEAEGMIEKHKPAISHQVIMDLSSRGYAELRSAEGKQAALDRMRDRINEILEKNTGKAGIVEDVYFSSFVMQ